MQRIYKTDLYPNVYVCTITQVQFVIIQDFYSVLTLTKMKAAQSSTRPHMFNKIFQLI